MPNRTTDPTKLLNRLRITDVGEYIRFESCDRRFRLKINRYEAVKRLPERLSQSIFQTSLDPILEESGHLSEQQWSELLLKQGLTPLTDNIEQRKPIATYWYDFTEKWTHRTYHHLSSPLYPLRQRRRLCHSVGSIREEIWRGK